MPFRRTTNILILLLGMGCLTASIALAEVDRVHEILVEKHIPRSWIDISEDLTLPPASNRHIYLRAGRQLQLIGPADDVAAVSIWEGDGRGLWVNAATVSDERGGKVIPANWFRHRWITLFNERSNANNEHTANLQLAITRTDVPIEDLPYRISIEPVAADQRLSIRYRSYTGAGSESAIRLSATRPVHYQLQGPRRLKILARALFNPEEAGRPIDWQISLDSETLDSSETFDSETLNSRHWTFRTGIDQTPPVVDGEYAHLGHEREIYFSLPEGKHQITLTADREVVARVRELSDADRSIVAALIETEHVTGTDLLPASSGGVSNELLSQNDAPLYPRIFSYLQQSMHSPMREHYRQEAIGVNEATGQWTDLEVTAADRIDISFRRWQTRNALPPGDKGRIVLAAASLGHIIVNSPTVNFVTTEKVLTFTRQSPDEVGLLRIITESGFGSEIRLVFADGTERSLTLRSWELNQDQNQYQSAATRAFQKLQEAHAQGLVLANLADAPVRESTTLQLHIPAGVRHIRFLNVKQRWIAVQERKLRRNSKPAVQMQISDSQKGQARANLAAKILNPELSIATGQLPLSTTTVGWLQSQFIRFSRNTRARNPILDHDKSLQPTARSTKASTAPSTTPSTTASHTSDHPIEQIRESIWVLDHASDQAQRHRAMIALTSGLQQSGEASLLASVLRGAVVHEPIFRREAIELLSASYQASDNVAGKLTLASVQFAFEPTDTNLARLAMLLKSQHQEELAKDLEKLIEGELVTLSEVSDSPARVTGLVTSTAGIRRLINRYTGLVSRVYTVRKDLPVTIASNHTSPITVVAYPHLMDGFEVSNGLLTVSSEGSEQQIRFTNDIPTTSLIADYGRQPAAGLRIELPGHGPWTIQTSGWPVDLSVTQMITEQKLASSDHPGVPANKGQAWFELPANSDPFHWPVVAPAERTEIKAARYPQPDGPEQQMQNLIAQVRQPGANLISIYGQALQLEETHPDIAELKSLRRSLDMTGTWEAIDDVRQSAGIMVAKRKAQLESGEYASTVMALLGVPSKAQRVIYRNRILTFYSEAENSRQLTIDLQPLRPAYRDFSPVVLTIRINQSTIPVALATTGRSQSITLPAGISTVEFALDPDDSDAYIAITINENGEALPWNLNQRYHIATQAQPIVVDLDGPGLYRIQGQEDADAQKTTRYLQTISPESLTLTSSTGKQALFRIHRRHASAPIESMTEPVSDVPGFDAPADPVSPIQVVAMEPLLFAEPSRQRTWSTTLESAERSELEDRLTNTSLSQRYLEASLTRRSVNATEDLYHQTSLKFRRPDLGNAVVGLDHRSSMEFPRFGLSGFIAGDIRVQKTDPVIGSEQTASATRIRLGLSQLRRIGSRSTHTPSIELFARHLSLDDITRQNPGTIDQDIYTSFKSDHGYGVTLADTWRYTPRLDTQLYGGASLSSNEDFSVDRIRLNAGAAHLLGPIALSAEVRFLRFVDDEDRTSASSAKRLSLKADWRHFNENWSHWSADLDATWDIDQRSLTWSVSLHHHFGAGRGLLDFRPGSVLFRNLYDMQRPFERIEK